MVNLVASPEQLQLVDSVIRFLSKRLPLERLRTNRVSEHAIWSEIAELGWAALGLPLEAGEPGFGFDDEILIYREFGRVALSPNLLATRCALHAALAAGREDIVSSLGSGATRAAIAVSKPGSAFEADRLSGTVQLIDADHAAYLVLWNERGLAVMDRADLGDGVLAESIDWSSTLRIVQAVSAKPLIWANARLAREADVLAAAMLVGQAEATRDMASDYAKIRKQFGRAIGSFQAIKHHCANMAVRADVAWAETLFGGLSLAEGHPDAAMDVHSARILAADAAIRNAEMNIQVHGGIGFTAEADPQLFVKRAQLFARIGGDPRQHQRALMALQPAGGD